MYFLHMSFGNARHSDLRINRDSDRIASVGHQRRLATMPVEKIVSARKPWPTALQPKSIRYFVQELVALPDRDNRAWRKKQLEKIVRRIQENSVGRADHSLGDFVEDVKRACAREAVPFDNDILNELVR